MKVLVSGYYGFQNLGDEALLSGLLNSLAGQKHQFTVLSNHPEETRALHGVNAVHRYKAALPALLATNVLISGGGGLLQDKTSRRSLQYYLGLIRLAKLLGKKVIIYGQSVGPLSDSGKQAVKAALKRTQIAVRDKASQNLLAELGLDSHLVADAALLMPKPEPAKLEPYTLLIPRHGYPEITQALMALARALSDLGQTVAMTAVQADEDDRELERLLHAVPTVKYLPAKTPQALLEIISGSSYVVSGRLHGLVLAARAGVNYAGLIYDPKVKAFLEETAAPAFGLPVDEEKLVLTVLHKERQDQQKVDALVARAQAGAEWLNAQLR